MQNDVTTLGEKLAMVQMETQVSSPGGGILGVFYTGLNIVLLTALTTLPVWWLVMRPDIDAAVVFSVAVLFTLWLVTSHQKRAICQSRETTPRLRTKRRRLHSLLADDRQGFMWDLWLDKKTVIFDGSNLYHFGLDNELGTRPLALVVRQLRTEGYRVVCFFDANIFYALIDSGAIAQDQRHSMAILEGLFGLRPDEIYVVPSGVQADQYILDSLKHLPISFAVTNDQFRDYAKLYPTVMKGDQWRKSIVVSNNEIRVLKHRFATPVYLT